MLKLSGFATACGASAALLLTAPAQAQEPYVNLSNGHSGIFMVLDLSNRLNPNVMSGEMKTWGQDHSQFWALTRGPDSLTRIHNRATPGKCLDVAHDGVVYMDTCGQQIGQRWTIQTRGNSIILLNQFKPGQCLDVTNAEPYIVMMAPCDAVTGQSWSAAPTSAFPDQAIVPPVRIPAPNVPAPNVTPPPPPRQAPPPPRQRNPNEDDE